MWQQLEDAVVVDGELGEGSEQRGLVSFIRSDRERADTASSAPSMSVTSSSAASPAAARFMDAVRNSASSRSATGSLAQAAQDLQCVLCYPKTEKIFNHALVQ
jgi:hypothetical protein